jgi:hypothetical protein
MDSTVWTAAVTLGNSATTTLFQIASLPALAKSGTFSVRSRVLMPTQPGCSWIPGSGPIANVPFSAIAVLAH